jgi:hypothetical protein
MSREERSRRCAECMANSFPRLASNDSEEGHTNAAKSCGDVFPARLDSVQYLPRAKLVQAVAKWLQYAGHPWGAQCDVPIPALSLG